MGFLEAAGTGLGWSTQRFSSEPRASSSGPRPGALRCMTLPFASSLQVLRGRDGLTVTSGLEVSVSVLGLFSKASVCWSDLWSVRWVLDEVVFITWQLALSIFSVLFSKVPRDVGIAFLFSAVLPLCEVFKSFSILSVSAVFLMHRQFSWLHRQIGII